MGSYIEIVTKFKDNVRRHGLDFILNENFKWNESILKFVLMDSKPFYHMETRDDMIRFCLLLNRKYIQLKIELIESYEKPSPNEEGYSLYDEIHKFYGATKKRKNLWSAYHWLLNHQINSVFDNGLLVSEDRKLIIESSYSEPNIILQVLNNNQSYMFLPQGLNHYIIIFEATDSFHTYMNKQWEKNNLYEQETRIQYENVEKANKSNKPKNYSDFSDTYLFTITEARSLINHYQLINTTINNNRLRLWIKKGFLKAVKNNDSYMIQKLDLDYFIKQYQNNALPIKNIYSQ